MPRPEAPGRHRSPTLSTAARNYAAAPRPRILNGVVDYAAVTHPLRAFATDKGLYAVFLKGGDWLFGRTPPKMFSKDRRPVPLQPVAPGSVVRISVDGDKWMQAVQIIELADDCPFDQVA
jgi:hypothetical protein